MRILQICHKPPYPAVDGGAIAMNNITQGLIAEGHEVNLISISTPKHPVIESDLPKEYIDKTNFKSVFIDTQIKFNKAFFNLFSNGSYNIERFVSADFSACIEQTLKAKKFDVIILESLFVTPYIPTLRNLSSAKIILRAHNVEHKIWERISENTANILKRKYINFLARRMKNYELSVFNQLDAICAMTAVDVTEFKNLGFKKATAAIPTGYILKDLVDNPPPVEEDSIFHLASMDWLPNVEGVNWFLNNVWENVYQSYPQAKLYLAGREMPQSFYDININNVTVVGPVISAKKFFLEKNIMIVPILSGSGMRIKIIEGMALGKVIISTSIGAEGIKCKNGEHILIANTPKEFSEHIIHCLKDKSFCEQIGKNAKKLIENEYSNRSISKKMTNFFEEL